MKWPPVAVGRLSQKIMLRDKFDSEIDHKSYPRVLTWYISVYITEGKRCLNYLHPSLYAISLIVSYLMVLDRVCNELF